MHRRNFFIAGGSLMVLSACAANGVDLGQGPSPASLAEDARIARAVLPVQTSNTNDTRGDRRDRRQAASRVPNQG